MRLFCQLDSVKKIIWGFSMTNWLITGGCGFIGTRLIEQLLTDDSNRICVIDNLSVGTRDDLLRITEYVEINAAELHGVFKSEQTTRCSLVEGDILRMDLAMTLCRQANVVVHLAANTGVGPSVESPREDCQTNITGTLNYLEGARQNDHCRFIFASSGAPLGEVAQPPIHEQLPANPVSPYGASKLAGEGYCSAYYWSYGVETVALRFGNVYGPGSEHKDSVVAKFIKKAINRETLEIFGDGKQTRDFIYIDDLVQAILASGSAANVGGNKYQIATNRESTVGEVVEMLKEVLESQGISDVCIVHTDARTGDVMRNYSDITKAKEELSWEPQYSLREGLEQTVRYFTNKE